MEKRADEVLKVPITLLRGFQTYLRNMAGDTDTLDGGTGSVYFPMSCVRIFGSQILFVLIAIPLGRLRWRSCVSMFPRLRECMFDARVCCSAIDPAVLLVYRNDS